MIQAPDNNLDPMNALSGADIGFGFKNMKSALDRIGLQWLGSADSPPYPFNVIQAVTPSISYVTDAKGNLDNGGTTYGRRVTVGGRASKSERIELRDGSSTLVAAINVGADENWPHVLENLTLKTYSLTAKESTTTMPNIPSPRVGRAGVQPWPCPWAGTRSRQKR